MWSLLALFSLASAQDTIVADYPLDVERFRPVSDTYGYAVTESATTLYHLQMGVGAWGNYSQDSLVLHWQGERLIGPSPNFADALLDHRSVVNLQFGFGLFDRISLTMDAPIVAWQQGFEPAAEGSSDPYADLLSSGMGDLRITPKVVLFDIHSGYPVGLALLARASLPTGSERSFIGEGSATVEPLIAFEVADGSVHAREYRVRGALNLGLRLKDEVDSFRGSLFGNEFIYRAALSAHPSKGFEIGTDLNGVMGGTEEEQQPVEILPWMKVHALDLVTLTAGAGFGLNPGLGSPDVRFFLGWTLAPSFDPLSLDRDGDGVPNKLDACINIPEDLDGFEDEDGCPDDDNDRDGLFDVDDKCPDDPEDMDGFEDTDGCPDIDNDQDRILDTRDGCPLDPEDRDGWQDLDGCPEPDNDGDGLLDAQDRCPNAAETFNGHLDDDGCPDEKPFSDMDGDGYVDDEDGCPQEPEDFDTFEDEDGCPDLDNDFDGLPDTLDDCPFDPETMNGFEDEDGCPDTTPPRVVVELKKIRITEKIFFEVNKDVIEAVSFELLDEVANVIKDHPHIEKIQIGGHTDSDGSEGYNQKLSQKRAIAVKTYLVEAGVEEGRLDAVGFGEAEPVDTNKTVEGRANNRRVEFLILEQR